MDLVQTEPGKAMTLYIQLVKFEKYVYQQSMDQEQYKDLSLHLKKSQIRLKEELDAVLTK